MLKDLSPKFIAAAVVGPIVALGATWAVASTMASPELVSVGQQGCGAPVTFEMPLRAAHEAAPALAVTYGPVPLTTATPVSLSFDPTLTAANEVTLTDGVVVLPMTFGNDRAWPKRIRINCRDGAVNSVRFERDRAGRTFNVRAPEPEQGTPQT